VKIRGHNEDTCVSAPRVLVFLIVGIVCLLVLIKEPVISLDFNESCGREIIGDFFGIVFCKPTSIVSNQNFDVIAVNG